MLPRLFTFFVPTGDSRRVGVLPNREVTAYFCSMYPKATASRIRQQFFTIFGQYMSPVPSADGEKINWINYRTGIRNIFFRIETPNRGCSIGITITHPDTETRLMMYERLLALFPVLEQELETQWTMEKDISDEHGKPVCRLADQLNGVSILNESDWPEIISFLKPRLVALDSFWSMVKPQFDEFNQ